MRFLFLESLSALIGAWIAVEFVVLAAWSRTRSPRAGRAAGALGIALPLLVLTSWVVRTDREQIRFACQVLAKTVDDGDVAAIENLLSPSFESAGWNRSEFLSFVERTLTRYRVDAPRLGRIEVHVNSSGSATAEFTATAHVHSRDLSFDRLPSRWRLRFQASGNQWLVAGIESIPIPPLNLGSLRGIGGS